MKVKIISFPTYFFVQFVLVKSIFQPKIYSLAEVLTNIFTTSGIPEKENIVTAKSSIDLIPIRPFFSCFFKSLFLVLIFLPDAYSQYSISGKVQEADGNVLPFANVLLLSAKDSSFLKGMVTNETGSYTLENVNAGRYILVASVVGYQKTYSAAFALDKGSENHWVEPILLHQGSTELNEVVVSSQKPLYEQKIDRLVINVSGSTVLSGGSAWEVLKRSPGLTVDESKGNITMNGKNGVLVLINGKPTNTSLEVVLNQLRGMSASNIERIELLQSPPAQFDAEGNAGAINIVLKKNTEEGFNGTVGLSGSSGRFNSERATLDINWRRGRLNLYGNGYLTNGMGFDYYLEHDRSFVLDNIRYTSANKQYIHHVPQRNAGIQVGGDYEISPKTKIGLVGSAGFNIWGMHADSKTTSYAGPTLTDSISSKVESTTITTFVYSNLNFTHLVNARHEVSLDADYAYYLLSNPGRTQLDYMQGQNNNPQPSFIDVEKNTPFHIWVGKGDYTWNDSRGQKLNIGLKTSNTQFENRLRVEDRIHEQQEESLGQSTQDKISEFTHAAYASAHISPAPKWNLQTGLRYEYNIYSIQASEPSTNYLRKSGRWFPTLFVTHNLDSIRQLQFSYNRRINRPSYSQLAAYFIYLDPYMVVTGNPNLLPATTDVFNLTYSWKSVLFTISYGWEKNAIFWRNIVDIEKGVQLNQQHNFDDYRLASITMAIPIQPVKGWEIQLSTTLEHRNIVDQHGREFPVHLKKTNLLGNITQTFTLPWKLKFEMNGKFITGYLDGEQARSAIGALDLALQKQVTQKGGNLSLALIDAFNSADWMDWNFQQKEHSVRTYGIYQFSQRHLRLSYSHPFGNQKVKKASNRSTASEEERNRAGN